MRPKPTLTSLRAFSKVGQCLSITKAAEALNVTQSAVSRQVSLLEETLDIKLFVRTGNTISLTQDGAAFHQRIFQTFGLLDDAVDEAMGAEPRQTIHLLAPPTFAARWLTRRLGSFRQRFPDFDLAVHTDTSSGVRMDCAVRYDTVANTRQHSMQLFVENHVAVCSPEMGHDPEAMRASCLLQVLSHGERLPLWENWFFAAQANHQDFPQVSLEFATLEMAIQAAKNGVGLAVVDKNMIEFEFEKGGLVQIEPTEMHGPMGYWLEITTEQLSRPRSNQFYRWLQSA